MAKYAYPSSTHRAMTRTITKAPRRGGLPFRVLKRFLYPSCPCSLSPTTKARPMSKQPRCGGIDDPTSRRGSEKVCDGPWGSDLERPHLPISCSNTFQAGCKCPCQPAIQPTHHFIQYLYLGLPIQPEHSLKLNVAVVEHWEQTAFLIFPFLAVQHGNRSSPVPYRQRQGPVLHVGYRHQIFRLESDPFQLGKSASLFLSQSLGAVKIAFQNSNAVRIIIE